MTFIASSPLDAAIRAARAPPPRLDLQRLVIDVHERLDLDDTERPALARYSIRDMLGRGGQGAVYRAFDPALQRWVALKVIEQTHERSAAVLLEEARTLAQVRHPHVVEVFDAGVEHRRVYIAMRLIEGETLRDLMSANPRPGWPRLLELVRQAASGLAAAHAAEIVHADFKPRNVLVTSEGSALVADFGLSRCLVRPSGTRRSTGYGGTPAYMAPEQHEGAPPDERCDQYACGVTLWEGLFGARPFFGRDMTSLAAAKRQGPPRLPDPSVPAWVTTAVRRALAVEPSNRFASMEELVDALSRPPRKRRRIAAAAIVGGALLWLLPAARSDPCEVVAELPIPELGDRDERLARRIERWQSARRQTCREFRAGALDDDTHDDRRLCLEQLRADLMMIDASWSSATAEERSSLRTTLARSLDPFACRDRPVEDEAGGRPDDPALHEAHARLAARLQQARALNRTGRPGDAIRDAIAVRRDAERVGLAGLAAHAGQIQAAGLAAVGRYEEAERVLSPIYFLAVEREWTALALRCANTMTALLGHRQERYEDALSWVRHGRTLVERRHVDALLEADLEQTAGIVLSRASRFDEAKAAFRRALDLHREAVGERDYRVGADTVNLGALLLARGDHEAAHAQLAAGLDLLVESVGEMHPLTVDALSNLGLVALYRDDPTGARRHFLRALALHQALFDVDHPQEARLHLKLANAARASDDDGVARTHLRHAVRIGEQSNGAQATTAIALANLAELAAQEGDPAAAANYYARAEISLATVHGPDHVEVVELMQRRARSLVAAGDTATGIRLARRALALWSADEAAPQERIDGLQAWLVSLQ